MTTTKNERITALLLAKRSIAEIFATVFTAQSTHGEKSMVYRVRTQLIKAGKLKPTDNALQGPGTPIAKGKPVQFHPNSKSFQIHALLAAGKTAAEIVATSSYTKSQIYTVLDQIKKKQNAGKPGKAMVLAQPKKLAKILKNGKANGHALVSNGFDVPVVEAILHVPGNEPVRVFSSVDIFPQVYMRAAKVTGFIP